MVQVLVCAVAIPATVLCVLSRSQRLSFLRACVTGRIGFQKGFVVNDGKRHKRISHWCRAGQGRKGSGGSNHKRWQKGVDVQILFGEMALQAMLSSHPGDAVREVLEGGRSKVRRVVSWLLGLEWRGRDKSLKPGRQE